RRRQHAARRRPDQTTVENDAELAVRVLRFRPFIEAPAQRRTHVAPCRLDRIGRLACEKVRAAFAHGRQGGGRPWLLHSRRTDTPRILLQPPLSEMMTGSSNTIEGGGNEIRRFRPPRSQRASRARILRGAAEARRGL